MMKTSPKVWVVSSALKATLKKDKAAAVIGNLAPNHRPLKNKEKFSESQMLEAILHWFSSLPFELQEDFHAFYREENRVQDSPLLAGAA